MQICKKCHIEKPLDEFHKDKAAKLGVSSTCKVCKLAYQAKRHKDTYVPHPRKTPTAEDIRQIKKRSYDKHRDAILARRRASGREDVRRWQEDNPEKVTEYRRTWKRNNPHKLSAGSRKRREAIAVATPKWVENEFEDFLMREIYDLAKLRTEVTGFAWHVDHKVPLISPLVCGLHCPANLEVIPAKDNMTKSNLYWEDMP